MYSAISFLADVDSGIPGHLLDPGEISALAFATEMQQPVLLAVKQCGPMPAVAGYGLFSGAGLLLQTVLTCSGEADDTN